MSPFSILLLLIVLPLAAWLGWDFLRGHPLDVQLASQLAASVAALAGLLALIRWTAQRRTPGPQAGRRLPRAYRRMLRTVRRGRVPEPEVLHGLFADPPRNAREYRLLCVARHSQGQRRVDRRFVQLSLLLDGGPEGEGERWRRQGGQSYDDLRDLLAACPEDPALVLLGAPGCGKSTLLRRLEYDLAGQALRRGADDLPLTWLMPLNEYNGEAGMPPPPPAQWLLERWAKEHPRLPPLETHQRNGLWLLLDGLNELPHRNRVEYAKRVLAWRDWIRTLARGFPNSRALFTCRSLDYSERLSSDPVTVPHAEFRELDDGQVRGFLEVYLPDHWQRLWAELEGSERLKMERTPFYLRLEVEQFEARGGPPGGRAELFGGIVWQSLRRELEKGNPLLADPDLLTPHDRERIADRNAWLEAPHRLPEEGALLPALARLAYLMQRRDGGGTQVRSDYRRALKLLDHPRAEDLLRAGQALALLGRDQAGDRVFFDHQLFQEYFAARRLAVERDFHLLLSPWRATEVEPGLAETLEGLGHRDRLPPLPVTGWEETARLAAVLADDPPAFVAGIATVNLPLAGRCAAQSELSLADADKEELATALVGRSRDPAADLRARVAAALALGELGDPRLARRGGPHGDYLPPPLVTLPGGPFSIGSEQGGEDERPVHEVELEPFALGQFPVTNAEWRLFMEAGGYEDERWWDTEQARAWLAGELDQEEVKQGWREVWERARENLEGMAKEYRWTPDAVERWKEYVELDAQGFDRLLDDAYSSGRRQREPVFWHDPRYNNPAQPVVGVSWYEARAYCNWLSAQSGRGFRLPGEARWEAAARGVGGREFAWDGGFDQAKLNFYETHLRTTTPVGIFAAGNTPEGLADMSGNVWEWTASLFRDYPINPGDGRDDPAAVGRRVLRGGSFHDDRSYVRAAYRSHTHPSARNGLIGFRVCCVPPPIES